MTDKIQIDRTVVEQALEALNASMPHNNNMNEDWPSHIAARRALRAALEQPQVGEVVVTTNQQGQCVAVTRQDDEGQILSVIWQAEQPQVEQEPVAWQRRMRTKWMLDGEWWPWQECSKEVADDYKRAPIVNDWEYESRALYTHPQPPRQPLTDAQINDHRLALAYDSEDLPDPWDFKQGVRAAELAHGIGGEK